MLYFGDRPASFVEALLVALRELVDDGSEFMAEFETASQAKGVALYLLPPRSPQMNGAVERAACACWSEFHENYDLPAGVNELNPHRRRLSATLQPS
jgi:hypothetical protein